MPIYAYRCASCGHAKDVLQKMSDAPLSVCPACGKPDFQKQVTAAGFQLKGSGWYVTDFREGSKTHAANPAASNADSAQNAAAADAASGSTGSDGAASTGTATGSQTADAGTTTSSTASVVTPSNSGVSTAKPTTSSDATN